MCPPKFLNFVHELKSAILAIIQKELGWPCPVCTGHKKGLIGVPTNTELEMASFVTIQIHIQTVCIEDQ